MKSDATAKNIKIPLRLKFDYCLSCIYGNLPECKNLISDDENYCKRYEKYLKKIKSKKQKGN
ncbi:MAG: hypothetical protein LBC64_07545 [Fibromonadaceae bacterium]|jgi:hypothetical protein|nr:hypothetical protein [Fibromonadaceae bacterium]